MYVEVSVNQLVSLEALNDLLRVVVIWIGSQVYMFRKIQTRTLPGFMVRHYGDILTT